MLNSTRGIKNISAASALVSGIAADGGLYVPSSIPSLDWKDYTGLSYKETAARILSKWFPEFGLESLQEITDAAYSQFSTEETVPIHTIGSHHYIELFHG